MSALGRRSSPTGLIGPESGRVFRDRIRVNDTWCQTLFAQAFPSHLDPGWLDPLYCYPGEIDVSLHVDPIPNRVAASELKQQRARHESTVLKNSRHGHITDPLVEAAAEEAAEQMRALGSGDRRMFDMSLYITVRAASEIQLEEQVEKVRGLCASLGIEAMPLTVRRTAPFSSTLPIAADVVKLTRPIDTKALATFFPFVSAEIEGEGGVLYGRNATTGGLVLLDRFALENYNQVVLAHSGKGKSYFAKLQVLRSLYQGIEALVVDPENEYGRLAEAVGGSVVRLGTADGKLNPFDLAEPGKEDAVLRQSLLVHSVIECLLGAVSPDEKTLLDRAIVAAYENAGVTPDPRTHSRPAPLLDDAVAALNDAGADSLVRRLEPFVAGSHRGLFDGQTSVRPDGHLVVFSLREVPPELKAVATLVVLDAIWRRVTSGERKRRVVVVDEAWMLLQSNAGARFLERLARSARKHWCGLTTITQDVRDALSTDIGRTVVTNAASQVLFGQHPQALDALCEAFALSQGERSYLATCPAGLGLVCVGTERATLKVIASETEHRLVTSDPAELALEEGS